MHPIAILTENKNRFTPLVSGFGKAGNCQITWHASVGDALEAAADSPPQLLIIDDRVGQMDCLAIARQVVETNAMINQALVSPLSEEAIHQASEGLGIMAHLTPGLKEAHAQELLRLLSEMP